MNTTMNMEKLEQDAADIFHQGFACSESVIYAIRKHFGIDLSDEQINKLVDAIKAKLNLDKAGDLLGGIGKLFDKR